MSLHHRITLVLASVSLGLAGCGSTPAPVDAGVADSGNPVDVVDVPVTPADVPMVDAGVALTFTSTLSGRQVVPPAYTSVTTGTVSLTLNPERTLLSYTIAHTILLPMSTQLHIGLAGETGPMAIVLMNRGGMTTGTTGVTADQARAIVEGRAYVNITSSTFPEGELRGQLVQPGETVYTARLSTDQENPPNMLTSSGVAEFLVDTTANRVRFVVHTAGMPMPATASHIHTGAAGTNGGVIIDLATAGTPFTNDFSGTRTVMTGQIPDLEAGRWYVNVHSAAFGAGEIRGQILRPGERLFIGRMTGAEESPPVVTMATGSVAVIVNANRDGVSYDGVVAGVTPMAAHLHSGAVGMNGDVVIPLMITGNNLRGTAMIGAGGTLLMGLAAGTIYANVHSTMFPAGEIRGQMRAAPATP